MSDVPGSDSDFPSPETEALCVSMPNQVFSATDLIRRFEALKEGLARAREAQAKYDEEHASRLNVFHFLGIHEREVKTHSAMLAGLLNPVGPHGQRGLFLGAFLSGLEGRPAYFPNAFKTLPTSEWEVHREYDIGSHECESRSDSSQEATNGRLDILLRHEASRSLIVIENKVYAGDRSRQLQRYLSWMKTQRTLWPSQALLYLTLSGSPPAEGIPTDVSDPSSSESSLEPTFACLSYWEDIIPMLESTIPQIRAEWVAKFVEQYVAAIRRL